MAQTEASSSDEIDVALNLLPDWTREGDALAAAFKLASFCDAVAFIARVGFEAEAMNHHPEIVNVYNRVSFKLSTHDAGDVVTGKDLELAKHISAVARLFIERS